MIYLIIYLLLASCCMSQFQIKFYHRLRKTLEEHSKRLTSIFRWQHSDSHLHTPKKSCSILHLNRIYSFIIYQLFFFLLGRQNLFFQEFRKRYSKWVANILLDLFHELNHMIHFLCKRWRLAVNFCCFFIS